MRVCCASVLCPDLIICPHASGVCFPLTERTKWTFPSERTFRSEGLFPMCPYESRRSLQWCARLRIKSSHGAMLNPHTGLPSHPHTLLLSSSFPSLLAYFHCSFLSFGISFCFLPQISIYYSPPITSQKGKICCWLIVNSILGFCLFFSFHVNRLSFVVVIPAVHPLYFGFDFELFPPLFWSPNRIHFS